MGSRWRMAADQGCEIFSDLRRSGGRGDCLERRIGGRDDESIDPGMLTAVYDAGDGIESGI